MNKRNVGSYYENIAEEYLINKGYVILNRNYRCRFGEIDIICRYDSYIVFVEVKYRSSLKYGEPVEAVTYTKQRKICRTASYFIMNNKYGQNVNYRFDIIGIMGNHSIIHYENAFEYTV